MGKERARLLTDREGNYCENVPRQRASEAGYQLNLVVKHGLITRSGRDVYCVDTRRDGCK